MPNDQLKIIVEADVVASGSKIASQLKEIASEVNQSSKKLKLQVEMDKESFSKEIEKIYQTSQTSTKKVKIKIFDKEQLDKEGREYIQGVSDKISGVENLTKRLQTKFGESAKIQIVKDEEIGIIKSFTVSVQDAEGALKKLNFERAKFGTGRGAQAGFVETKETYDIKSVSSKNEKALKAEEQAIVKVNTAYNELLNINRKISSKGMKLTSLDSKKDVAQIELLNSEIKNLEDNFASVFKTLTQDPFAQKILTMQQINTLSLEYEANLEKIRNKEAQMQTGTKETFYTKFSESLSSKEMNKLDAYNDKINKIIADYSVLGDKTEETAETQRLLGDAFEQLKGSKSIEEMRLNMSKLDMQISLSNKQFKRLLPVELQGDVDKLSATMTAWLSNNTKAAKAFGDEINKMQATLNSDGLTKGKFKDISTQFQILRRDADAMGLTTDKLSVKIGNMAKKFTEWFAISRIIMEVTRLFKQMVSITMELDNQFNRIRMVTGDTAEETKNLMLQYQQLAKEISSTTTEVAASAEEFLRQGRSLEDTNSLIRTSQILSKVGMLESQEAAELLTSSINGYKISVQDAMSIVDKMAAIDVAAATSTQELAKAMAETATGAKIAGISMDTLLAYIGTVSDVTRDSAETIGTAFKNIFARIGQVKLGSLEFEGEDISNVETALKQYGITLRDSRKQLKDTSVVIQELANKWKTLELAEKNEISEQFAGWLKVLRPEHIVIYGYAV